MATSDKLITALSKRERADLLNVKAALSAQYLRAAAPAVAASARARSPATAVISATQRVTPV